MKRISRPPGYVGVAELIGTRDKTRPGAFRRPRPARPGLVPYPDAAWLWAEIAAGRFPQPVRGPWGIAWPLDVIHQWRRRNRLA